MVENRGLWFPVFFVSRKSRREWAFGCKKFVDEERTGTPETKIMSVEYF